MEKTNHRKKTVALYNEIFEKGLTSSELQVYFALLLFENSKTHYCHVKHRTLATEIGTNEVNVSRALNKLCSKGLISIRKRYNRYTGDQVSNGYYVKQLTGRFCVIKTSVLRLMLPKSVFKVYLYLLSCRNTKTSEAFPSLSQMVSMLHMSKRTIIDAIKHLTNALLLTKENYKRKTDNRLGHNRYRILTGQVRLLLIVLLMKAGIKKRLGAAPSYNATPNPQAKLFKCTYNIACSVRNVKTLRRKQAILFRNYVGTILYGQERYSPRLRLQLRI